MFVNMGFLGIFKNNSKKQKDYEEIVNELELYSLIIKQLIVSENRSTLSKQVNSYYKECKSKPIQELKVFLDHIKQELNIIYDKRLTDRIKIYNRYPDKAKTIFCDAISYDQLLELLMKQRNNTRDSFSNSDGNPKRDAHNIFVQASKHNTQDKSGNSNEIEWDYINTILISFIQGEKRNSDACVGYIIQDSSQFQHYWDDYKNYLDKISYGMKDEYIKQSDALHYIPNRHVYNLEFWVSQCTPRYMLGYKNEKRYNPNFDGLYMGIKSVDPKSERPLCCEENIVSYAYDGHTMEKIFGTEFVPFTELMNMVGNTKDNLKKNILDGYKKNQVDRTISDPETVSNALGLLLDTCKKMDFQPRIIYKLNEVNNENQNEALNLLRQMYLLVPEFMRPSISFIINPIQENLEKNLISIIPTENNLNINNQYCYDLNNTNELPEINDKIKKYLRLLCAMEPTEREKKLNEALLQELRFQHEQGITADKILRKIQYHFGDDILEKVWERATRGLELNEQGEIIHTDILK